MNDEEKKLYDSIVHSLRSKGWSRIEAEGEAISMIDKKRRAIDMYFAQKPNL